MKLPRILAGALLLAAGASWAGPGVSPPNQTQPRSGNPPAAPPPDDRAELDRLRSLFERAVNENRFDLVKPYIDPQYRGTSIAGTDMVGPDQIQAFMDAARHLMGPGATYRLKIKPGDTTISGDRALSEGTTEEEIVLRGGRKLSYKSLWSIGFAKKDGKWYATRSETKADLRDKVTVAAHVVASRIWNGGLDFKALRLWRPDFDQDNGEHAEGASGAPPPPTDKTDKEKK